MDKIRNGNFTSSGIVALTKEGKTKGSLGAPALTYIDEKNMERRLDRALNENIDARPIHWGNLLESRAFELLGLDYSLCSDKTIVHPEIDCWTGTPDLIRDEELETRAVCDLKCPFTLKSFCQFVDSWESEGIDGIINNHKDGEKYYWQLVSNAVLTNSKYAELIVYMPYKSELEAIRESTSGNSKYYWVWGSSDQDLPYLLEDGHYKNVNVMRFEVPYYQKEYLKSRVLQAKTYLIKRPNLVIV